MSKQTAVEWLAEQMLNPQNFNPYIEKALQIEKQQIIDAYQNSTSQFDNSAPIIYPKKAEQYYNEQFKKK